MSNVCLSGMRPESVFREAEYYMIPLQQPSKELTLRTDGMYKWNDVYHQFVEQGNEGVTSHRDNVFHHTITI